MNKVTELAHYQAQTPQHQGFSSKQVQILKSIICPGITDDELEVFMMTCTHTNLDPFIKQIYAVKRGGKMTIQTGIDGYRLIAERTHCYAPGPEPTYTFRKDDSLESATSYVKKLTQDGTWHTIAATAYFDEYCKFNSGSRTPAGIWGTMPKTMLAKCAEAVALRRAFPGDMTNVYTAEEMDQADNQHDHSKLSLRQAAEIGQILDSCDPKYKAWVMNALKAKYNADTLCDVPITAFSKLRDDIMKNMEAYVNQCSEEIDVTEVE